MSEIIKGGSGDGGGPLTLFLLLNLLAIKFQ